MTLNWLKTLDRIFRVFRRSQSGNVAIQIGLSLILIIGMVALGTEIGYVLYKHRQMQSAADTAALAGATALAAGYPADYRIEASAVARAAGYVDGANDATVTVNNPPRAGPFAGNASAVEVTVERPQKLGTVTLFRVGLFDVGARAVALAGTGGAYCVLALDPSASGALLVHNRAQVTNPVCGVAVNSSSSGALVMKSHAIVAGPVTVHGGWSLANKAQMTGSPLAQYAPVVDDPYASIQVQTAPACTSQSGTVRHGTAHLSPGHFCDGWNFAEKTTIKLAPGTYYIDKKLATGGQVVIDGTGGVTLVIQGDYAISIESGTTLNISAPSSGPYAGLALFGDRAGKPDATQTFSKHTVLDIKGAIYFPNQVIDFENNGMTTPDGCTQVIGREVSIGNDVELGNNCAGAGVTPIGVASSVLVE